MTIFRGQQIRGDQIFDRSISGAQISQNSLSDEHFANNAAINETKLNINWHAHTEALEDRKLVDFVQVGGISATGTNINLESFVTGIAATAHVDSNGTDEGIIVSGTKNIAPMRDATTGEPIVASIGGVDYEVIARVEYNGTNYQLSFYTASGASNAEVAYDFGATPVVVDIQYAQRFNLKSVDEMFAANEKFVYGAADITSHLNIEQLAKDIYGATWAVNRNGEAKLSVSLSDALAQEVNRAQIAETTLQTNITNEATARVASDQTLQNQIDVLNGNASVNNSVNYKIKTQVTDVLASNSSGQGASTVGIVSISGMDGISNVQAALEYLKANAGDALVTYKNDLASTAAGQGASLVGVDAASGLNAANVQGVLVDHENRLDTAEATLAGVKNRAATTNSYFDAKTFDTAAARFADDETTADSNFKRIDDAAAVTNSNLAAEVTRATNKENDLDAKIVKEIGDRTDADSVLTANLSAEVTRATNKESDLDAKISQEAVDRSNADSAIRSDLASTANAKGASLIGVEDAASKFTATNVEGVFAEINTRLESVEQTGGVEVVNARNSELTGTHASLDERLETAETRFEAVKSEVDTARGTQTTLNNRLSVALRNDGYLVDDKKLHIHKKYTFQVSGSNQSVFNLPTDEYFNMSSSTGSGTVVQDSVQVYVNGILQANGICFTEVADVNNNTHGVGINFTPDELQVGDVLVIEWVVNNAN